MIKDTVNKIKELLQSDITYIKGIYVGEDAYKLMIDGKISSFINIEVYDERIDQIDDDISIEAAERKIYTIILKMVVRNKSKSVAEYGTQTVKGIWDLIGDIWNSLKNKIDYTISAIGEYPETQTATFLQNDIYIAQAEMRFTIWEDSV